VAGGVALAVAGASVVAVAPASAVADPGMSVAPMPVTAVPLARAGEVTVWGVGNGDGSAVPPAPAALSGVAVVQVAVNGAGAVLALTAAGDVVGWGQSQGLIQRIPSAVTAADVSQIAVNDAGWYAAAVTRAGTVLTWGPKQSYPTPLNVPAGLSGVTQVALGEVTAVALRGDGSVVAWGKSDGAASGMAAVPAGLKATAVAATANEAFALTEQGTVVAWGGNTGGEGNLPPEVEIPGNVKAIAATNAGAMALLADGSLVGWGQTVKIEPGSTPESVLDAEPVSITAGWDWAGMVDRDGVVHHWWAGPSVGTTEEPVPGSVQGRAVAQFAVSGKVGAVVITTMLRGELPQVTGAAAAGGTLSGVAGTFSASPDAVTGQWLSGGAPIPGATGPTLSLTPALVGKQVAYQSTATKAGYAPVSSTSAAVTVTEAGGKPEHPVASKTTVGKVKVAKGAKKLDVTGKVAASKSPAGKAKVTIKQGKKTIVAKNVKVSTKGTLTLTVKNFGKLVIKKLTPKKKGKKGKKPSYYGTYVVTIAYAGNAQVNPSKAAKKFTVKKTKPKKGKK
jgi:hypothetical protein